MEVGVAKPNFLPACKTSVLWGKNLKLCILKIYWKEKVYIQQKKKTLIH